MYRGRTARLLRAMTRKDAPYDRMTFALRRVVLDSDAPLSHR